MPDYRRIRIPGGTYFFTVNLLERYPNDLLVRHIDELRDAVRRIRIRHPFHIDAWGVLPDHLHAVWTLPPGDDDYANRWRTIKQHFSRALETNLASLLAVRPASLAFESSTTSRRRGGID